MTPTQRELAEAAGVSKSHLRESVIRLENGVFGPAGHCRLAKKRIAWKYVAVKDDTIRLASDLLKVGLRPMTTRAVLRDLRPEIGKRTIYDFVKAAQDREFGEFQAGNDAVQTTKDSTPDDPSSLAVMGRR